MSLPISIIIPTLNEAANLKRLLPYLFEICSQNNSEIIISDGGSQDGTVAIAQSFGAKIVRSNRASRAIQMNLGSQNANGEIYYFVHADTKPPPSFKEDILNAVLEGFKAGRYQSKYQSSNPFLRINAYFTRYNWRICQGGDQGLFVCKSIFKELGGFSEKHLLMEDYDLTDKLNSQYPFKVLEKATSISGRKYESNSYIRVNLANYIIYSLYYKGVKQEKLIKLYKKLLK